EERMQSLVDDIAKRDPASLNPEEHQVIDLYRAFTNTEAIEKNGLAPVQKDLKYIAGLKTLTDVSRAMGTIERGTANASLFASFITTDAKSSHAYAMYVGQGGLGMPDRDYYVKDDPELAKTRTAYKAHLAAVLGLLGEKNTEKRAQAVFDLETE